MTYEKTYIITYLRIYVLVWISFSKYLWTCIFLAGSWNVLSLALTGCLKWFLTRSNKPRWIPAKSTGLNGESWHFITFPIRITVTNPPSSETDSPGSPTEPRGPRLVSLHLWHTQQQLSCSVRISWLVNEVVTECEMNKLIIAISLYLLVNHNYCGNSHNGVTEYDNPPYLG